MIYSTSELYPSLVVIDLAIWEEVARFDNLVVTDSK